MGDRELTEAVHSSIRARMEERRLTVKDLAERAGMKYTTLRTRLASTGNLDLDDYDRIAVVLGARDVEELIADARRGM